MLNTQIYLQTHTLDELITEFSLIATYHPIHPLVILNYHQLDSPKNHPISNECRGLVLELKTNKLVAKAFNRFYDACENFDWTNFATETKLDGSLIIAFNYNNHWFINTRKTFGELPVCDGSVIRWRDLVLSKLSTEHLNTNFTYVFEFVSPLTQVVRLYPTIDLYLLSVFNGMYELPMYERDIESTRINIQTPERHNYNSLDSILDHLTKISTVDSTWEGVVVRDYLNNRIKIKTDTYRAWHALKGNEWLPKNILPFILSNGVQELKNKFPLKAQEFDRYNTWVNSEYNKLVVLWTTVKHIEDQKTFALTIKDKTPFTGLLFTMKKNPTVNLYSLWVSEKNKATLVELLKKC